MRRFLLVCASLLVSGSAYAADPIRTGIEASFPPHAIPTLAGGAEGFNIDLGNALAAKMHRPITIDLTTFSTLIPGLQAGRYDFLVAVVFVTKERSENLLFTEPYLATKMQFAIKKGGRTIKSLEDLSGRTISVVKGSSYDSWLQAHAAQYGFKVDRYETSTDALQAVISGHSDANLSGDTFVRYNAAKLPDYVPDFAIAETKAVMAFPVRKDNVAFRNQLDDALKCLKKDGTVAKLSQKWMGTAPGPTDLENVVDPGHGVPGMANYDPTPHEPDCK